MQPHKVLVVGCATGLTVQQLHDDFDWGRVYGIDISQWAVDRAVTDRVFQGDAFDEDIYDDIARDAQGPPRWDSIYTELVIEHYDDAQAVELYDLTRDIAEDAVIHRTWSGTGHEWERDEFNLKTIPEWIALCGDHDDVYWIDYDRPEDNILP